MGNAASFLPETFVSGGAVPDGHYKIQSAKTVRFNYGGAGPETPALEVTFEAEDGSLTSQCYSAGKIDSLIPSEDGKRFVHPTGEAPKINRGSNFALWVGALVAAGFPGEKLGDGDVGAFEGLSVDIENRPVPVRAGLQQREGKTIPLVSAIGVMAHPRAGSKAPAKANGAEDLNAAAIGAIQLCLGEAKDNTLAKGTLGTRVMLRLAKTKDPNAQAIKKLAQDSSWLVSMAEAGGWSTDGDTVTLA